MANHQAVSALQAAVIVWQVVFQADLIVSVACINFFPRWKKTFKEREKENEKREKGVVEKGEKNAEEGEKEDEEKIKRTNENG